MCDGNASSEGGGGSDKFDSNNTDFPSRDFGNYMNEHKDDFMGDKITGQTRDTDRRKEYVDVKITGIGPESIKVEGTRTSFRVSSGKERTHDFGPTFINYRDIVNSEGGVSGLIKDKYIK